MGLILTDLVVPRYVPEFIAGRHLPTTFSSSQLPIHNHPTVPSFLRRPLACFQLLLPPLLQCPAHCPPLPGARAHPSLSREHQGVYQLHSALPSQLLLVPHAPHLPRPLSNLQANQARWWRFLWTRRGARIGSSICSTRGQQGISRETSQRRSLRSRSCLMRYWHMSGAHERSLLVVVERGLT